MGDSWPEKGCLKKQANESKLGEFLQKYNMMLFKITEVLSLLSESFRGELW